MRLRPLLKPVLNRVLPPLTKAYLRKPRTVRYDGLTIRVEPGVFHPGLYFSTKMLIDHLRGMDLKDKKVLEIGVGSGMVSIWAAKQGAQVTGTDISPTALACARGNGTDNGVAVNWVESDLFEDLATGKYDLILVNPPYYPGTEYFQRFFGGLGEYLAEGGQFRMILSEDCALDRIGALAAEKGWAWEQLIRERRWGEYNYIFGWN